MPLVRSPHECHRPAVTAVNRPVGATDWLWPFHPQQVTVPLVRSPQVCRSPVATAEYDPLGTSA